MHIHVETQVITFEDCEVEDLLFMTMDSVIIFIRNIYNFRMIGWIKRGDVQDQGVDQSSNGLSLNAGRVIVQSGRVNYCITKLDPTHPGIFDLTALNRMKFDVVNGY